MRSRDVRFDDWAQRARDRDILEVAHELGAVLKRTGQEWIGPCPLCAGVDGFGINQRKRVFICRRGQAGGDAIAMTEHLLGCDFVKACEFLTGEPPPRGHRDETDGERQAREQSFAGRKAAADRKRAVQERKETNRVDAIRTIARRLWDRAEPIQGTLGEAYLRGRGIDFPLEFPSLRFAPVMEHRDGNRVVTSWPAIVCCVQGPDMRFRGIWRIYLDPAGNRRGKGRAPVSPDKAALGPVAGGAVWLGKPGPDIKRCEGVETGLGVYGIGLVTGQLAPVACCMSTSGLISFERPPGVTSDLIYPDGDADKLDGPDTKGFYSPGLAAAECAKMRSIAQGQTGTSIEPTARQGWDYLDIYCGLRKEFLGK